MRDVGRMEREFLDVLDYELSVSEADLLDLHETIIPSRSSQLSSQLHPFFHVSALELAPRPQAGVQMFRTHRVSDDDEDEQEEGSVSSGSLYGDEASTTPTVDEVSSSGEATKVETDSLASSSSLTPTSSNSSSEPSTAATSAFSYHPHMVSKPNTTEDENTQRSVISRALWLAGHQLISSLPSGFPQLAVPV
jgi:hypothetical protein